MKDLARVREGYLTSRRWVLEAIRRLGVFSWCAQIILERSGFHSVKFPKPGSLNSADPRHSL